MFTRRNDRMAALDAGSPWRISRETSTGIRASASARVVMLL
jgi:hypothetical protein